MLPLSKAHVRNANREPGTRFGNVNDLELTKNLGNYYFGTSGCVAMKRMPTGNQKKDFGKVGRKSLFSYN